MKKIAAILAGISLLLTSCSMLDFDREEAVATTSSLEEVKTTYSGFYYDQLDDNEQTIYQQMLAGCQKYESEIKLSSCTKDELQRAETAFVYEHPEFFWISNFNYQYIGKTIISIGFDVPEDAKEISSQINEIADRVVSSLSGSDYDKVKAIYEYIVDETDYNLDSENNQDIRSVFLNHESVCAGYTRAFQFLCQKIGIPCTYVSGTAKGGDHAWNLIYINDNYYWVDATWGDPIFLDDPSRKSINYDYLCVSDENFTEHTVDKGIHSQNYSRENVFNYPVCADDSLNYYRLQGMYFEGYDRDTIEVYLREKIEDGITENIQMKFADASSYHKALNDLFAEQAIYDMVGDILGYRRIRCSYVQDEDANYLSVSFSEV